MKLAQRFETLPAYPFAELERRIGQVQASGVDVIRLDVGSPDLPPAPEVVDALAIAVRRADAHGYTELYGLSALREAIAAYYRRRFDVALDPATEILPLQGAQEGIVHAAAAFLDPGSVALLPDPGYPAYRAAVRLAEGEIYALPLRRESGFLPDFAAIPAGVLRRARLLWLNYPHNPTTACADRGFLERAVAFAREHGLLLVYDNVYADVAWGPTPAPSILQIEGAREVAVELNSLSKLANMAGWRVGLAVGGAEVIVALAHVKANVDSSAFGPLQEAAATALRLSSTWSAERNAVYAARRAVVTRALDRMRLWYAPSAATMYVWIEAPPGFTGQAFAAALLTEAGVSLFPGEAFGAHGAGYVRLSLVQPTDRLEAALERWERWLISKAMRLDHADWVV